MRSEPQVLFAGRSLRDYAYSKMHSVTSTLERASEQTLTAENCDDLISRLYAENQIILPSLKADQITQYNFEDVILLYTTPTQHNRKFKNASETRRGIVFSIDVPFDGDPQYFTMQPIPKRPDSILGYLGQQSLSLYVVPERTISPQGVQYLFDEMLSGIKNCMDAQASMLPGLRIQFEDAVRNVIKTRLATFSRRATIASALRFPLRERRNAPQLTVPLKRTVMIPAPPPGPATPQTQAVLAEEHYQAILGIMDNMARAMEFSPTAFATLGEEALRFHFLVLLNGVYEGAASGETFNHAGKTDILVRYQNANVFVAECKIWSGPADFADAIDQLQRYVTWRDTKTAIVVFNRNKGFTSVIESAIRVMDAHPQRKSSSVKLSETTFRYTFAHLEDPAREYSLTLMLFNVPTPAD